jgi:hypothetical protein
MPRDLLAETLRRFAEGDLSAVDTLREASRDDVDALVSRMGPLVLTKNEAIRVLRELDLEPRSQHVARIWAYFWRERQLPQQLEGESPYFNARWEQTVGYDLNEVMAVLSELGDDDTGWLQERNRDALVKQLENAEVAESDDDDA